MLMATNAHVTTPKLMPHLPFDPLNDFTPLMRLASYPMFLLAHPSVAQSLPELIEKAKQRPGDITAANLGVGSVPHLAAAQLALAAGIELTHVPYGGSAAASLAVLSGECNVLFFGSLVMEHVRRGRLRVLGVGSAEPSPDAPDVRTIAEQGYPGFEATAWYGLMGPPALPTPLVSRLHQDCRQALDTEDIRARMLVQGIRMEDIGPAEFGRIVAADLARWADVITRSGIQPS
jgi:tripartite-type tricarboxylate transporter receptor subunit TctC